MLRRSPTTLKLFEQEDTNRTSEKQPSPTSIMDAHVHADHDEKEPIFVIDTIPPKCIETSTLDDYENVHEIEDEHAFNHKRLGFQAIPKPTKMREHWEIKADMSNPMDLTLMTLLAARNQQLRSAYHEQRFFYRKPVHTNNGVSCTIQP